MADIPAHRFPFGACPDGALVREEPGRGEWSFATSDEGSEKLINNRQNGRRRGRGGIRPQNGAGGGQDRGNRIDNRARGNANQLHEKYKTLARDAQMQGDRVMTEYYLQFADHYFRVLSESRSRFDEQQPRRDRFDAPEFDEEEGENDGNNAEDRADPRSGDNGRAFQPYQGERGQEARGDGRDGRDPRQDRELRQDREYRPDREPRFDREPRQERAPRQDREERDARPPRAPREEQPRRDELPFQEVRQPREERAGREPSAARAPRVRREEPPVEQAAQPEAPVPAEPRRARGRPRRVAAAEPEAQERIEIDRLPPAFAAEPAANGNGAAVEEEAPAKPKRTRRPRAVAPAAEA